jgi:hypothetical protein
MKNIKKFENFVNEELKSSTYRSAADKLKKKGFGDRAEALYDYSDEVSARDKKVKIEPVTVKFKGYPEVKLDSDSIMIDRDVIVIIGDKDLNDALNGDESKMYNLWNKYKLEFRDWMMRIDPNYKFDAKLKWENVDPHLVNSFNEYLETEKQILLIIDDDKNLEYTVSGNYLDSRADSFKVWKFVKEFIDSIKNNPEYSDLKVDFSGIKVNDFNY